MRNSILMVVLSIALIATAIADVFAFDPGGTGPRDLVVSPDGQYLYVVCSKDSIVTKIRISDHAILDSVFVAYDPIGIEVTPDGQYLFVTNTVNGYYTSKIEVSSFDTLCNIHGGTDPAGLDITPDGSTVVITNHWSSFLQLVPVDSCTEIGRVYGISTGATDVVITPDGNYAYVVARTTGPSPGSGVLKVSLIDTVIVDTIPIDGGEGIDITPDGSEVWVPGMGHSDYVYVISTVVDSVVDSIAVGALPRDVKISPDGNYAYVCNHEGNSVSKISTQSKTVVGLVGVAAPHLMAITPDGSKIFVSNYLNNTITEIDLGFTGIWCDDFESYLPDSTIGGTIWIISGNNSCIADSSISFTGNQSVKMYGVVGGCWGAVADRLLGTYFPMTIEFAVRNGTEALSGCHPYRAGILLRAGAQWTDPQAIGLCVFLENGDIRIISSVPHDTISGFNLEEWYKFKVEVFATEDDSVHIRYWANDDFLGEYKRDLASLPDFYNASHLDISAQEGTVWFDDVCVSGGLIKHNYLPGDMNMYYGDWPPAVQGADVTYYVNFMRQYASSIPCFFDGPLGNFWTSADVNGSCAVDGADLSTLVSVMRNILDPMYCDQYPPAWPTPLELPPTAPDGWPNCVSSPPVTGVKVIQFDRKR